MTLDLTPEEREECLEAYTDEYKNSSGGPADTLIYRIRLQKIGIDWDEISYLVRINRP